MINRFHLLFACSAMAIVFACSEGLSSADENEVGKISKKENAVYFRAMDAYEIDTEKSTITLNVPVCRAEKDSLIWAPSGERIVGIYKYHSKEKTIRFDLAGESFDLHYDRKIFPIGNWLSQTDSTSYASGFSLDNEGIFTSMNVFSDSCAMKNLRAVEFLGKEIFGDSITEFGCRSAKTFRGMKIVVENYRPLEIAMKISHGDISCAVKVSPRFAINREDCEAAFAEYRENGSVGKFQFEDFAFETTTEENCMENLLKSL